MCKVLQAGELRQLIDTWGAASIHSPGKGCAGPQDRLQLSVYIAKAAAARVLLAVQGYEQGSGEGTIYHVCPPMDMDDCLHHSLHSSNVRLLVRMVAGVLLATKGCVSQGHCVHSPRVCLHCCQMLQQWDCPHHCPLSGQTLWSSVLVAVLAPPGPGTSMQLAAGRVNVLHINPLGILRCAFPAAQ